MKTTTSLLADEVEVGMHVRETEHDSFQLVRKRELSSSRRRVTFIFDLAETAEASSNKLVVWAEDMVQVSGKA